MELTKIQLEELEIKLKRGKMNVDEFKDLIEMYTQVTEYYQSRSDKIYLDYVRRL